MTKIESGRESLIVRLVAALEAAERDLTDLKADYLLCLDQESAAFAENRVLRAALEARTEALRRIAEKLRLAASFQSAERLTREPYTYFNDARSIAREALGDTPPQEKAEAGAQEERDG
jgi:hypothetical protein